MTTNAQTTDQTPGKDGTAILEQGFAKPPDAARPWVYWFWMDGNVTKEGITADLDAMRDAGVGGALMMGVGLRTPPGKADFNSPLWRELYAHAASECVRLGLRLTLHSSDGWGSAGGPWITPAQSMKKLVWTVTEAKGPSSEAITLARPKAVMDFYEDVAVLAVPVDASPTSVSKAILRSEPPQEIGALVDGNAATVAALPPKAIVDLEFAGPKRISTIIFRMDKFVYGLGGAGGVPVHAQAPEAGGKYRLLRTANLNMSMLGIDAPTLTISFDPVETTQLRLVFENNVPIKIADLTVSSLPREHLWEVKSSIARDRNHGGETKHIAAAVDYARVLPAGSAIPADKVVNLTGQLGRDGRLNWQVPSGPWLIYRIGMTSTGKYVAPRTNAGEGLEADKMSGDAIRHHFASFAKGLITEHNKQPGNPIYSVHTDSWESNIHTWSTRFQQEFEKRRGYSMTPWLPVLTSGILIGSAEESERFLWDVRRTMADLIADNFYGEMARLCHENGILFQSEAAGRQMFMYDPINYKSRADIPVGEFWRTTDVRVDCKVAASVAHTYNRPIAAAESFTGRGGFRDDPFALKALGDHAFATGINRFIIHRYCMQPWIGIEPGMTFGPYGINFERTQTWWKNGAKAWCQYVTRCQALLQTGQFVGDVIHYIGDDAPNYLGHRSDIWNPIPEGYDFDGCNLEILQRLAVAENGELVLPHGARYRVLLLPKSEQMTLPAIETVERLVKAGATAIGPKPLRTPGLANYKSNDAALRAIAEKVWGGIDGKTTKENRYGKGRMIYGSSVAEVLAGMAPPDFSYTAADGTLLRYIHRRTADADFYFVANADSENTVNATVRFRVSGKAPELWDASTGGILETAIYRQEKGITELPLDLDRAGSVFVVFRRRANSSALVAVACDGAPIFPKPAVKTGDSAASATLATAANNADVVDSFTMAAWIKPGKTIGLSEQGSKGVALTGVNHVIYPAPGHELYGEKDAGIGLSAGTNGLVVIAHGARLLAPLLVHKADLGGWNHVAVVFRNRKPELYLNGALVKTGVPCPLPAHPSTGVTHGRGKPSFSGEITGLVQRNEALDAAAVALLMSRTEPKGRGPAFEPLTAVFVEGKLRVSGGRSGRYSAQTAEGKAVSWTVAKPVNPLEIGGAWKISFPPDRGASAAVELPKLMSWTGSGDNGVKYFAGTATYTKRFEFPADRPGANRRILLDLGQVKNVAEVRLNGKDLGVLWKPPFRVDVTEALKSGENLLEARITNLWPNRLIGDEKLHPDPVLDYHSQGPAYAAAGPVQTIPDWVRKNGKSPAGRSTFVLWKFYGGDEPLLESGLLGPVCLVTTLYQEP